MKNILGGFRNRELLDEFINRNISIFFSVLFAAATVVTVSDIRNAGKMSTVLEQLQAATAVNMERSVSNETALSQVVEVVAEMERDLSKVPEVIANTIRIEQLLSRKADIELELPRLRRIIEGHSAAPATQIEIDEYDRLMETLANYNTRLRELGYDYE